MFFGVGGIGKPLILLAFLHERLPLFLAEKKDLTNDNQNDILETRKTIVVST
jgi:hypothetical protein